MKKNMGTIDRLIRSLLALAGIALMFVSEWFIILTIVMGFTAMTGFCPLYTLFKCDTLDKKEPPKPEE